MLDYNKVLLEKLQTLLGDLGFLMKEEDCASYVSGARYGQGKALAVLRPNSHEQVVEIVKLCAEHEQKLVLQGANTGLVAASTPDNSGKLMVMSLQRINQCIEIDAVNRSVIVDVGVSLQDLNDALAEHDLCFPIDLGANPSIGGMIAANTGGARLIKYGDVRQNLLGLRAVLMHPAGEVVDMQTALRKNNTGPDLKQLFVGSSGAFGIITRAVLQVHRVPKQVATALVVPRDQDAVLELLQVLERDCGDFLSAFEGISGAALTSVVKHIPNIANPFAPEEIPPYCVLLELSSTADAQITGINLEDILTRCLENLFETIVINAVIGRSKDLWKIRHAVSEALRHEGKMIAFDISMPRSLFVPFRTEAISLMNAQFPWIKVMDFGHWADGGCHFNVVWPTNIHEQYDAAVVSQIREKIYDLVVGKYQGSFSAEHGVGPYNMEYYQKYSSVEAKNLSNQLQQSLDPKRLLGLVDFG